MVSQQLIIQCDVCSVLQVFTYQTNCNILRTKSNMEKTIHGDWSSLIISRVLSNKTNLIFISYTL